MSTEPKATEAVDVDIRSMQVGNLMGKPPITVGLPMSLTAALGVFATYGVRHLVVVDAAGGCAGVLTDRAVAAHWAGRPMDFDRARVEAVYEPDAPRVAEDATLAAAAHAMREAQLDAVVVTGARGEPIGVVTATDLIAAVATPRESETRST
jgi:CBS domain-containing protein